MSSATVVIDMVFTYRMFALGVKGEEISNLSLYRLFLPMHALDLPRHDHNFTIQFLFELFNVN